MNSLLKAFKEFYNEINGATLTGAIDVIVVEQSDGSFICSPFHVRFGKLGVLRSREKIVDIEVNGEPVNIHMKLGESGEAFFVEECLENDLDELPANLTTSPLPTEEFSTKFTDGNDNENNIEVKLRRNSTVLSQTSQSDIEKIYENQISEYRIRRHSEKVLEPRDLSATKHEYTTEQIRHEIAAREAVIAPEQITIENLDTAKDSQNTEKDVKLAINSQNETSYKNTVNTASITRVKKMKENDNKRNIQTDATAADNKVNEKTATKKVQNIDDEMSSSKDVETKSKKKRRKKSMMKKKAASAILDAKTIAGKISLNRKGSLSSSGGSASAGPSDQNDQNDTDTNQQSSNATSASIDDLAKSELAVTANDSLNDTNSAPEAMGTPRICDLHFFSDTEIANSPYGSRPSTPIQSDSEFEMSQRDNVVKNENNSDKMSNTTASWKWGELPTTPNKSDVDATMNKDAKQAERNSTLSTMLSFMKETIKLRKSTSEGVYLSDLIERDGMDPDVVAMYFPPKSKSFQNLADGDDHESGNGTSLPHSPSSLEGGASKCLEFDFEQDGKLYDKNVIALSLCGGLDNNGPSEDEFDQHLIEYSEVCRNPSIFTSPLLVVRLCGKYYSWSAACPIVMTAIAYRKPLSNEAIEQLMNTNKTANSEEGEDKVISNTNNDSPNQIKEKLGVENRRNNAGGYSWWNWRRSTDNAGKKSLPNLADNKNTNIISVEESIEVKTENLDLSLPTDKFHDDLSLREISDDLDAMDNKNDDSISSELADISKNRYLSEKYRKTLRLTSEQIESLNLKPGMNELEFSVTTAYQGTSRCKCYVFRWNHTDKVVISDIDGTITKSDVLGHILPMVGKDWAQLGVAELFTKIEQNGYKLLYLSARAIGQSRATRDYLRSIQQGDVKLPDGPLLLNPTSLISAFHREVIERKPEQFKIACLSDIKALFPQNPFYAGYGNRINDVWAYRAVGIPIIRIFTINPKGELKHELNKTFQSSYRNMAYIVDQLFPPVNYKEESVEFSNFNYWRDPVLDIDCDHLLDLNSSLNSNVSQGQLTSPPANETDLSTIPENVKV